MTYRCANDWSIEGPYTIEYDGDCDFIYDEGENWRIKFLSTGKHRLKINCDMEIDIFLVGGGGRDGHRKAGSNEGGGGYTRTVNGFSANSTTPYDIVVGAGGAATSAFGYTVDLGANGSVTADGAGTGKGGNGGSIDYYGRGANGSSGQAGVYEFNGTSGDRYGGGVAYVGTLGGGTGGAGGDGGIGGYDTATAGAANTGGGGSGIVIIRKAINN